MRRLIPTAVLDWLPLPVIFLSYHFAGWVGRLLARPSWDRQLLAWDQQMFGTLPGLWITAHLPAVGLGLLEFFYASYYILIPFAPWLFYARYGRRPLWGLWTALGASYLICDALFPWFPSTPPRLLFPQFATGGPMQKFNLWVLHRFSIGGNVFPSSHVAAATTLAICHLRLNRPLGFLFLIWAAGIAISTVSGGYHYAIDAVGGAVMGIVGEYLGSKIFARLSRPAG